MTPKNEIIFTVVYDKDEYIIQASKDKYFSLMDAISQHLAIDCFGICSGMGSCGTCMVNIDTERCESSEYRLACSIKIDNDLANKIIIICDYNY